jgi:mannitol-1-phosphate/altronate dehydrogenase
LGVGVTEAGLASKDTPVMTDLYDLLHLFKVLWEEDIWENNTGKKLCIVDMDNVPNNGDLISKFMQQHASDEAAMQDFLNTKVVFLNTMVDRITSQRPNNPIGHFGSEFRLVAKTQQASGGGDSIHPRTIAGRHKSQIAHRQWYTYGHCPHIGALEIFGNQRVEY